MSGDAPRRRSVAAGVVVVVAIAALGFGASAAALDHPIELFKTGVLTTAGATPQAGDRISYTFQITNSGNVTLTGVDLMMRWSATATPPARPPASHPATRWRARSTTP